MLGGVADERTPAGAHVEQPLSGAQVELAADEIDLLDLCFVEARVRLAKDRARVGHGGPEETLVEAVREVVVVFDRRRVALARMPAHAAPPGRRSLLRRNRRRAQCRAPQAAHHPQHVQRPHVDAPVREQSGERRVQVPVDLERAGHVGARQPELPGRREQVAQGKRRAQLDHGLGRGRAGDAAVIRAKADVHVLVDEPLEEVAELQVITSGELRSQGTSIHV